MSLYSSHSPLLPSPAFNYRSLPYFLIFFVNTHTHTRFIFQVWLTVSVCNEIRIITVCSNCRRQFPSPFFLFSTSVFPFLLVFFFSLHLTLPQTIELKLTPVKWSVSPLKSGNMRLRISVLLFFLFFLFFLPFSIQSILALIPNTTLLSWLWLTFLSFPVSITPAAMIVCVVVVVLQRKKKKKSFPIYH